MMLAQNLIFHDGQRLIGVPGVISSTHMGIDHDHDQFRLFVSVNKEDGTQAFVQMVSVPAENVTANLQSAVLGILHAAHVSCWEDLAGREVIALYRDDQQGRLGYIVGLCDTKGENIFLVLKVAVTA